MASRKRFNPDYSFRASEVLSQRDRDEDTGTPCARKPPELCDGARLVTQPDGTARREPKRTPRAFCDPCADRIKASLGELPVAYLRLAAAIGDPLRTARPVRTAPGSKVLLNPEVDALMRRMAGILAGWAARVRDVPGLQLTDPGYVAGDPRAVADACKMMALNAGPLLALQDGWTTRVHQLPEGRHSAMAVTDSSACRRCRLAITRSTYPRRTADGPRKWWVTDMTACLVRPCGDAPGDHLPGDIRPAAAPVIIPADLEDEIGDEEIVQIGDTWVKVMTRKSGADAGNEILDLHWRARCILGETKTRPDEFDGVPCRACDAMTIERAEPPSDPQLDANHSRCPACGDEMDRETFTQWADTYAQWAQSAGITLCKRCSLATPKHEECTWALCSCAEGEHPRRRAAA